MHDLSVHERLTALKGDIPDPVAVQKRQRPRKRVGIEILCWTGQRLVSGKAAKVAGSVADVCDRHITDSWG